MAAGTTNGNIVTTPTLWTKPGFYLFLVPYLLLYFFTNQNSLFWDTIHYAGIHSDWYYFNDFKYLLLPDTTDCGHPPVFAMYLAIVWKFFGRSLLVSHTAMLPFLVLIVAQAYKAGLLLISTPEKKYAGFITLVILTNTVLLSQCSLISPDVWLAAGFLLTFNAILSNNKWLVFFGVMLSAFVSSRAMMASVCLYLFALGIYYPSGKTSVKEFVKTAFRWLLPFLPAAIFAICFFVYHYVEKGWIGYHKDMPWAAAFEIVPRSKMLKHFFILGWRLADLGNVLTIIVAVWVSILGFRGKLIFASDKQKNIFRSLLILVIALFALTALPLIIYTNLLTHRYFLPLNLSIAILAVYGLYHSQVQAKKSWMIAAVIVQLSGNFWTYPITISQGWDSTLGHLPFYNLRKDFKHFMQENGIQKEEVATTQSLVQSDFLLDLQGDTTAYKDALVDAPTKYIWFCNVSNMLNKKVESYYANYYEVKRARSGNVIMILFQRKETTK